jgi:hypothetical protein
MDKGYYEEYEKNGGYSWQKEKKVLTLRGKTNL